MGQVALGRYVPGRLRKICAKGTQKEVCQETQLKLCQIYKKYKKDICNLDSRRDVACKHRDIFDRET